MSSVPAPVKDDAYWRKVMAVLEVIDVKMHDVLCTQCHSLHWWRSMYSVQHDKQSSLSLKNQVLEDEYTEYEPARRMIVRTAWCLSCWQVEQQRMTAPNETPASSATAPSSGVACSVCSKTPARRCSRCKHVAYCSPACQTTDWPRHKADCTITDPIEEWFRKHPKAIENLSNLQRDNLIAPGHIIVLRAEEGKLEFIAMTAPSIHRLVKSHELAETMCTKARSVQSNRRMFLVEKKVGEWYLGESAMLHRSPAVSSSTTSVNWTRAHRHKLLGDLILMWDQLAHPEKYAEDSYAHIPLDKRAQARSLIEPVLLQMNDEATVSDSVACDACATFLSRDSRGSLSKGAIFEMAQKSISETSWNHSSNQQVITLFRMRNLSSFAPQQQQPAQQS